MLGYIYTFFLILPQQSLHTTSLERSLFFIYSLLDERQLKTYQCNTLVFNLQRFERDRVYTGNELFNKLCTSLASIHHLHTQNLPCDRKQTMVGSQQEG